MKLLLTSAQDVHQLSFASCAVFEQYVHLSRDSRGKWIARPPLAPGAFRTFLAAFDITVILYCGFQGESEWRDGCRAMCVILVVMRVMTLGVLEAEPEEVLRDIWILYEVLDGRCKGAAWSVASLLRGSSRAPDKMKQLWPSFGLRLENERKKSRLMYFIATPALKFKC